MKILLANKFFFRNGGAEVVLFQEREYLQRQGHEVIDFSMSDERNLSSQYSDSFTAYREYGGGSKGIQKLRTALTLIHNQDAVDKMTELVKRTRPDVIHCHNIYHQLTPSIIGVAREYRIPLVLTLHDYKIVCPVYTRLNHGIPCSSCLQGSFRPLLTNRCAEGSFGKSALLFAEAVIQRKLGNYEKADAFISPSNFMAHSVSSRIPRERIHLLYNGVDTQSIQASALDEGYALYLGRLSAEKGISTLLAAHDRLRHKWPLVVAGTGPLQVELEARYTEAIFLGHLTGQRLRQVMERAAVVVVPSEWYENCSMSILEAMAYGKPVVASRMGGNTELVEADVSGLIFEAGNAMDLSECIGRLMGDKELRQRMGKRARARAEAEFSNTLHNEKLIKIYHSLLPSTVAVV